MIKYIAFGFMPVFLFTVAISIFLLFGAATNNSAFEHSLTIIISVTALAALVLYFPINIIIFLNMIKRQEGDKIKTFV